MPRKQRFKPTRKPKPVVEAPREVHPDDVGQPVKTDAPDRDPSAPDQERGGVH